MRWVKQGLIFNANNTKGWMKTHAAVPFADWLYDDYYRIYFSTRDSYNRSHTAYFEIDLKNTSRISHMSEDPVISPGELGAFDDSGAMGSCLVHYSNKRFLYYIGWNIGVTVPYWNSIGLAISDDNKKFTKIAKGPIIDRNMLEPYFSASNYVIIEDNVWKMWYLSCDRWIIFNNKPRPYYNIKYAESKDGINWERKGIVCINFKNENEWAISRPCVIKEKNSYKMWYSYSGELPYRIGYAESKDGIKWTRMDEETGINVSESGWDSESIEYPFVFEHEGTKHLLYCGNGFGKTGFGYAILE